MDLQAYFDRIHFEGSTEASISNLQEIHRAHVRHVPFENLDIHYQHWITLDQARFFDKIVLRKRGGFCYELNGLLMQALTMMGYEAHFISGSVFLPPQQSFGPYLAHVAILVHFPTQSFLVDVGFGSSFPEPLPIEWNRVQTQQGVQYVLRPINEEEILIDRSFDEGSTFMPMYKFKQTPRVLEDFQPLCEYHQTSEESPLYQKKLCSMATENGRITLTSHHLTVTDHKNKVVQEVKNEEDFQQKLKQYFGFRIQ